MKLPERLRGAQLTTLNAFCPFGPVSVSGRLVSGTSGTLANVTELVVRLTAPLIVSANGAGNAIVIVGAVAVPDSVTVPFASATLGTSGEVAVAVPIVQPEPEPVRHGTTTVEVRRDRVPEAERDALVGRLGRGLGDAEIELAALVLGVLDHRRGEHRGVGQPGAARDVQGLLSLCVVALWYESAVTVTFAAGLGQLVGSRSVVNERSSSLIASLGRLENAMLSPIGGVLLRVTSAVLSVAPGLARARPRQYRRPSGP